ncbi:MAG: recombination regulator RecX [Treponema sp.]|nr:recombination regulator RecX [Treponema sp.]
MAILQGIRAWLNARNTDGPERADASSSQNVSLQNSETNTLPANLDEQYIRAEKAALRLVARAEQCSAGLARKLKRRGHDCACINEVITKLTELNLLNDGRFACLWLQSRLRFTRSPRQLLSSLCARGIEHDCAVSALRETLNEDAENALLKKYIKKNAWKIKGAKSLKFFLKNEGFSMTAISHFLNDED